MQEGKGTVRKGSCCRSFPRGRRMHTRARTHTHTHTRAKRSWHPQEARAQAEAARASGTSVLPWGTSDTKGGSHLTWRPLEPLRGQGHALRRAGRQGMTRSDSISDSVDVNLSKLWETEAGRGGGVLQSTGRTAWRDRNSSAPMGTLQN